jgi:hypothetical protein
MFMAEPSLRTPRKRPRYLGLASLRPPEHSQEKGFRTPSTAIATAACERNDQHWTVEQTLAGRQEPTQVGRVLANLAIEMRYALSPRAKGGAERL